VSVGRCQVELNRAAGHAANLKLCRALH